MTTGLQVLGAISISYGFAKDIVGFLKAVHDAKTDIPSILLRFEDDALLLEHLTTLFDDSFLESLDYESLSHLQRIFSHILPVAQNACVRLRRYSRNKLWDRATWAVVGKDLQSSEEYIHGWIKRLQICLVLFPKAAKTSLVSSLQSSPTNTFLLETVTAQQRMEDRVAKFREIGYRQAKSSEADLRLSPDLSRTIQLSSQGQMQDIGGKKYLVEFKKRPTSLAHKIDMKDEMEEEVAKLVSILSVVQPTDMFLLRTRFFFESSSNTTHKSVPFGILYEFPSKFTLTLRLVDILRKVDAKGARILKHSLDQRFELARQISTAILFMHSIGWVHKGIRSSNVFLAHSEDAVGRGE